jgi:hypothetical protein
MILFARLTALRQVFVWRLLAARLLVAGLKAILSRTSLLGSAR